MLVIGLLSNKQEVEEIKYIAKVCEIENRIRFVVRMQRLKDMMKNDPCNQKSKIKEEK